MYAYSQLLYVACKILRPLKYNQNDYNGFRGYTGTHL